MANKNGNKGDGWILHSAETTCDVTGSKVSGTESYSKKRWFKGTPSEVKSQIQMEFDGYKYEITNIHTIEKYRRHFLDETNHGSIKNYEEKIIQVDSFGSGDQPFGTGSSSYGNLNAERPPQPTQDPEVGLTHKTATLKNMIDKAYDYIRYHTIALIILAAATIIGFAVIAAK